MGASGVTQIPNGDNISASYATIATPASVAGSYAITITPVDPGGKLSNYALTLNNGTLTISSVSLTVTANNASRQYGAADPSFTASYSGFVNGETSAALGGTLACASNDTASSPAGAYAIGCSGLSSSNYSITFVLGTLTVTQAPLTVTGSNASRQYGQANPPFTGTIAGLLNGDNITANYATSATPASPSGNYAITPTLVDPNGRLGNYAITLNNGTLTVTAAPLVITANNASRQYGQANPSLNSATYSGFVNGDTSSSLGGALNCTTIASPASPVGVYPITCAGLSSQNYSINSVPGTLTVTVAPLTIAATNMSKTYGTTVTFAGTEFASSGLLNADKVASVTLVSPGTPPAATVAGSPYVIIPSSAVGTGLGNYNISYVNGALTVTPALLTITANNAAKILNAPNPTLNETPSGFVNGESTSVLTANPTCTTTAITTSPVGSYPITCTGASAANYKFTYLSGMLKVLYATAIGHLILPPINADGTSVYNQGRTVPAKFSVYDANGVSIGTPGVVSSFFLTAIVSGTITTSVENVVDTNNPDTAFHWDPVGQQWIFNISTASLSAGSTYIYTITLNDGSTIVFQYGLV